MLAHYISVGEIFPDLEFKSYNETKQKLILIDRIIIWSYIFLCICVHCGLDYV